MAKKRKRSPEGHTIAQTMALRDAFILAEPRGGHEGKDYFKHVRLALLCRTRSEREIVGLHCYQNLSLPETAARLSMTLPRVKELYRSLLIRLENLPTIPCTCALRTLSKKHEMTPQEAAEKGIKNG